MQVNNNWKLLYIDSKAVLNKTEMRQMEQVLLCKKFKYKTAESRNRQTTVWDKKTKL